MADGDSTHFEVPTERERAACLGADGSLAHAAGTLDMLKGRWKLEIVFRLHADAGLRQSQLLRAMPGLTQKVLTRQLRELITDKLVERIDHAEKPLRVEYRLTPRGRRLAPVLAEARAFGAEAGKVRPC